MRKRVPPGDGEKLLLELTDLFHERGINLPTRTLYLGPDVGDETAAEFIKNLHVLERLSDDPITVLMNNCGGDDYNGLAMFDAVRLSPCDVTMVVRGSAMSMGSIILQAADRRIMGPLATQMIHYGQAEMSGHALTVQRNAREAARVNEWMEAMYLARIHERRNDFNLRELRALLDHDTYLTAEAAIDLGLADEIG